MVGKSKFDQILRIRNYVTHREYKITSGEFCFHLCERKNTHLVVVLVRIVNISFYFCEFDLFTIIYFLNESINYF